MACGRWIEFFEGDEGRLSMTRLLCFMSFFPASYIVVRMESESALGWYLSAYVLGYSSGKMIDMLGKTRQARGNTDTHSGKRGKHVDADI